jgi:hypothetical protein
MGITDDLDAIDTIIKEAEAEEEICQNCGHALKDHNMRSCISNTTCGYSHPDRPGAICPCLEFVPEDSRSMNENSNVSNGPVEAEYFAALPEDAITLKRLLFELQTACEERTGTGAKDDTKNIGAAIVGILISRFGDKTNIQSIGALAASLLYVLNETEKLAVGVAIKRMKQLPSGNLLKSSENNYIEDNVDDTDPDKTEPSGGTVQ